MERPPKKYVCEKCWYIGDTPEHVGCDYLAWTTNEHHYIEHLEAELAALRASPASAPEGSFNAWWNSDKLLLNNTYRKDSPAYWAWEGWCAALAAAIDAAMQEDKL